MLNRRVLLGLGLLAGATASRAQSDWRRVAVPYIGPGEFVDGVLRFHALPRAEAFAAAAAALVDALAGPDAAPEVARRAWAGALQAWAGLNAVAIGPLLERRSAKRIDFAPTRPDSLRRAIERLAQSPALGADEVGASARGFGALEWLLWSPDAPRDAAARRYALFVARDLAAEAEALQRDFAAAASQERSDDETAAQFGEIVNQWIGGLDGLRVQGIARAATAPASRTALPRHGRLAGAERAARWDALAALARFPGGAVPARGGALLPVETLLRGRGLNPLADRLVQATQRAGNAIAAARGSASPASLRSAGDALARLQSLAERELTAALDVRLGFSDADGD